ncbi:MAG: hypothetical protein K2J63_03340, partial [Muribaculaceae bacterium]|nr:hypothetical protein [Muribaculaceae bacterium]
LLNLKEAVRSNAEGFSYLIDIYDNIKSQEDREVLLVFDHCQHIDANLAAMLGSILDDLTDKGFKIQLTRPSVCQVRDSLSRNRFFRAFNPECDATDTENFIEYRKFSSYESEAFKSYIDTQLIKKQRFPAHTEQAGYHIRESIMEIFVNAVFHGECTYVYSCGEYHPHKTPPCLDMTIVDRGNTIPFKVNSFITKRGWQPLSPCEAIRWALKEGNTTKDIPGGLGLADLMEFLKLNQGALQIVSGSGMVEYQDGELKNFKLIKPFSGTVVNMEFNFNDDKNYRLADEPIDLLNLL